MAQESFRILYNYSFRPSDKLKLLAVPMYMYRIETNEFSHGLNFFEKVVLKLKARPRTSADQIAEFLGLDARLVTIIISELRNKALLNEHDSITPSGKEMLLDFEGIIVDSSKRRVGYIFKYVDDDRLYDYYVPKITVADVQDENEKYRNIITGTKGDGEDSVETPHYCITTLQQKRVVATPTEREIMRLVRNANQKSKVLNTDLEEQSLPSGALNIKMLNEQPEIVWVSTYLYLKKNDSNSYDRDWRVLDPFGYGDNIAMKFYLITRNDREFMKAVNHRFDAARILGGKLFSDFQEDLQKRVEAMLLKDFPLNLNYADSNLQKYIELMIKHYLILQESFFTDIDSTLSFAVNLQNTLENIIKQDMEKRKTSYEALYCEMDTNTDSKQRLLSQLYRGKVFSSSRYVPKVLNNQCRSQLSRAKSLLGYLVGFLLTYKYDNSSPLFKPIYNKVDTIISIAFLRNAKGHGQTASENELQPLSQNDADFYYNFIKDFINDFITGN